MKRRNVALNCGLGVALIGLGVGGYLEVGNPSRATAATTRPLTVSTGTITSTVTGSGNLASGSDTTVSPSQCTGKLTSVAVTLGQTVKVGQLLGTIDNTTATQNLTATQASLALAQSSSSASIANAQQSLANAQASQALDVSQSQASVTQDQTAVNADVTSINTTRATLATAQSAARPNAQTISADKQAVTSAQSKLEQDEASLAQASNSLAATQLKDNQQVASAQLSLSQASAGVGNSSGGSSVTSDTQTVATDKTALASCTLTAPVSGTIVSLSATVGATVGSSSGSGSSASSSASTSTTTSSSTTSSGFATISDLSSMQVTAAIAEADIASVKVGQPATLTFPAVTNTANPAGITATGAVSAIAPTSTVTSSVVTYTVTITVAHPPAGVRLGATTNVNITTADKSDVVRVPTVAISATNGAKTVDRVKGASTGSVVITTGITGGGFTEVTSGLTAGDEIALPTASRTGTTTGSFGGTSGVGG